MASNFHGGFLTIAGLIGDALSFAFGAAKLAIVA
jgi:hypothetical protein